EDGSVGPEVITQSGNLIKALFERFAHFKTHPVSNGEIRIERADKKRNCLEIYKGEIHPAQHKLSCPACLDA
ncbi:MAG TPA: hypothetical protein PKH07_01965, partial [bacterium]|nr:hypothetical protein [bacterium]